MASLNFGGTSDKVNCGTNAGLTNLSTGTYLAWVYPTGVSSSGVIITKGLAASGRRVFSTSATNTGDLQMQVARGTSPLNVQTNGSAVSVNVWQCIAAIWNTGGANVDQKLYLGTLLSPLTEPASYLAQTVGSGTVGDNTGQNQLIGNRSTGSVNFTGLIALAMVWNVQVDLGVLRMLQFNPKPTAGCLGMWWCGRDGSVNVMDRSGTGNHGTITGAVPTSDALPRISRVKVA